ncbi:MAG: hypothetical protein M1820_001008 [Bogoriella megaspora]|nr:MAG: hypothetical protein M1820_001008 [Bogoriella megaspora]
MGVHDQDLCRCRYDVVQAPGTVDDMDGSMDTTKARKFRSVLEIGTYTGFSALAWYEGTRSTKSEIVTIDLPGHVLEQTKDFFKEMGADDRIRVMEGSGNQELPKLSGEFELIFLDADKHNQRNYINIILEKRLLDPKGVILVDNSEYINELALRNTANVRTNPVFSRGLTMGNEFNPHLDKTTRPLWEAHGEALREFNKFLIDDPRIDVLMLPLFDGVTQIQWNLEYLQTLENERSRGSTGV